MIRSSAPEGDTFPFARDVDSTRETHVFLRGEQVGIPRPESNGRHGRLKRRRDRCSTRHSCTRTPAHRLLLLLLLRQRRGRRGQRSTELGRAGSTVRVSLLLLLLLLLLEVVLMLKLRVRLRLLLGH